MDKTQIKTSGLSALTKILLGITAMALIVFGAWNFSKIMPFPSSNIKKFVASAVTILQSFIPGGSEQTSSTATTTPNSAETEPEKDAEEKAPYEIDEILTTQDETETNSEIVETAPVNESGSGSISTETSAGIAGLKTENLYLMENLDGTPGAIAKPDLAVRILEIGIINKTTNEFTATTTLRNSDRVAVKFEIKNEGGAETGHWFFSAVLPTYPMHIFNSEGQQSLKSGDRIEYTIGFDSVEPNKDGRFVVNADPTSSISEINEDNNIATTSIKATSN